MAFSTAGAAAGATAGAALGPWGAAIGGIAGGFMGGSGGATSGSGSGGATATPQAAQAAAMGSGIDGSAWVVNFGDGNSTTLDNRQDKTIRSTGPVADASPSVGRPAASPYLDAGGYGVGAYSDPLGLGAMGLGGVPPMVWLFVGAVVLIKLSKRKH